MPVGGQAGVLCPGCHLLSPCPLGLAAWEEYPTLKMLMEMVMTKYVGLPAEETGLPRAAGPSTSGSRAQAGLMDAWECQRAASWAPVTWGLMFLNLSLPSSQGVGQAPSL